MGDEAFRTRPDRPWSPPAILYENYRPSFLGVKLSGRDINRPPVTSSAEVKERVQIYLLPFWALMNSPLRFPRFTVYIRSRIDPKGGMGFVVKKICYLAPVSRLSSPWPMFMFSYYALQPGAYRAI